MPRVPASFGRWRGGCIRITNAYMAASKVMTLRIEPALLEELRRVARVERRSLSGEVLYLVREQLDLPARRLAPHKPTMGWLAHLDVPGELAEFRVVRQSLSRQLRRRVGHCRRP